jgi:curved DNA-binding protein CbpA
MNPYLILGLPHHADDQGIRRAYLDAIKQATPENNPERFKLLTSAFEKIRDEPSRHLYELSNPISPGDSPIDVILKHFAAVRPAPISLESMKEYLKVCSTK